MLLHCVLSVAAFALHCRAEQLKQRPYCPQPELFHIQSLQKEFADFWARATPEGFFHLTSLQSHQCLSLVEFNRKSAGKTLGKVVCRLSTLTSQNRVAVVLRRQQVNNSTTSKHLTLAFSSVCVPAPLAMLFTFVASIITSL